MAIDERKIEALLRDFSLLEILERHSVSDLEVLTILIRHGIIDEEVMEEEVPVDGVLF